MWRRCLHWVAVGCLLGAGLALLGMASCDEDQSTPDVVPPAAITDLTAAGGAQGITLRWSAPGDDGLEGTASRYDIRCSLISVEAGWDSALVIPFPHSPRAAGLPESTSIQDLTPGEWHFGIRAEDESGNWSPLSNIATSTLLPDTIPPATITDFEVQVDASGFHMRWTAPGDDGLLGRAHRYDIRYASIDLEHFWDESATIPSPPSPALAGQVDSITIGVEGIGWGPWEFGIRTEDDSGNWSAVSNVVHTDVPADTEPPAAITDLVIDLLAGSSAILCWTAPGDDGTYGTPAEYELRYATLPITTENWASATPAQGLADPEPSGARESATVLGLMVGTTYYFALIASDEIGNLSGLSNVAVATLAPATQITFSSSDVFEPDWSSDGERIIYTGTWATPGGPERLELYVVPVGGGTGSQYTNAPYGAYSPSWAPDDARISFLLDDESSIAALAVMAASSGSPAQVLADHSPEGVSQPRWSPDGTWIAYVSSIGLPAISSIYKIPSSGGIPVRLTGGWTVSGLDWSSDGSQIVYASNQAGSYDVWVMPSAGGTAVRLTWGEGKERGPAWAPDGTKIAYDDGQVIWVMSPDGENPIQVTFGSEGIPYRRLSWSPDSKQIVFSAIKDRISNIWILRVRP